MKYFVLLFSLIMFIGCTSTEQVQQKAEVISFAETRMYNETSLPCSDNKVGFVGRVDSSRKDVVRFSYPGIQVKCFFDGIQLSVDITDYGSDGDVNINYFEVLLDGESKGNIEIKEGRNSYDLTEFLLEGKHELTLYKRTESFVGICGVHGFNGHGEFFELVEREQLRMEFIGNSIICGYGNGLSIAMPPEGNPTTGFTGKNENNFMSYSSIVGRQLDAEVCQVCYSGRGIFRNCDGTEDYTIPKTYHKIIPDEPGSKWDFSSWIPDVVLVNLGTNDFAKDPTLPLTDSLLEEAYRRFLWVVKNYYPESKIVLLGSPMITDVYPPRAQHATRMRKIQEKLVSELNRNKEQGCFYHEFEPQLPPYGEDWHPAKHTHQKMAYSLLQFLDSQVLE